MELQPKLVVTVVFLYLSFHSVQGAIVRASFGDACNATHRCEKREFLTCTSGSCNCVKPDTMVFEAKFANSSTNSKSQGRCVIKLGERCRFTITARDGNQSQTFAEKLPCMQNSYCDPEDFCSCIDGYYEDSNGTCAKFQDLEQQCDSSLKCGPSLVCTNGLCKCDPGKVALHDNKCVGLAGFQCQAGLCVANADCIDGICLCQNPYFQNGENTCSIRQSFGGNCTADKHCGADQISNIQLRCINGNCDCDPDVSVFSRKIILNIQHATTPIANIFWRRSKRFPQITLRKNNCGTRLCSGTVAGQAEGFCAPKPGQPCSYTHQDCSINAVCNPKTATTQSAFIGVAPTPLSEIRGFCTCTGGTIISNKTGLCSKPYGSQCSIALECLDSLVCKTPGICACPYTDQTYSYETNRCQSPPLRPCQENLDCNSFATCKRNGTKGPGHCVCKPGYSMDGLLTCKGSYNATCSFHSDVCDTNAGLACVEQRCGCVQFSVYSEKWHKCVGAVGSPCFPNRLGACTTNASCFLPRPALQQSGYCKCNEGFVTAPDFTCIQ